MHKCKSRLTLNKKLSILIIIKLFIIANAIALQSHNQRSYYISGDKSGLTLDSLSIIEESFKIFGPDKKPLNPAFYVVDYYSAKISLRVPEYWHNDSLKVEYRVFPLNLSKPYFHKDTSWISLPGPGESFIPITQPHTSSSKGLLDFPGISSSGSISRGVTVGNRQDLTLNSAMNLQLSGNLTDEIEVLAVISDQDIPIQPEGTTQQLQDFDKVFIQLSGYNTRLTAGDFEIDNPKGHFINFSRKSQGGMLTYETPPDFDSSENIESVDFTIAGAISKGIYARNEFEGMEGNQGPYRLTGNNNESYIIVIAGSERVFIDGRLLKRGMENDYVINYNQAEITFTSKQVITGNSRISIEFEYAARDYARSMLFTSTGVDSNYGKIRVNYFSEQDHPSQPLFTELTDDQRNRMAAVGDSIHKAFSWNFDSIGFKNDRVMYLLTDSLGYDTVFVHSTNPDKAHYQVGFTFVGENNGNYRQVSSSANGRVYKWIAPVNGQPQGTHEPIRQLVPPQKTQMFTLAYSLALSENTKAGIEWAVSNNDINLFSELDKDNNTGFALLTNIENKRTFGESKNWSLKTSVSHETANKNFKPVERYRSVEFERDWNMRDLKPEGHEHLTELSLLLKNTNHGHINYSIGNFITGSDYSGLKNRLTTNLHHKNNKLFFEGSLLNSEGILNTSFYRHNTGYTRMFSHFNTGIIHKMEDSQINDLQTSFLKPHSFAFNETELFVTNPENSDNNYRLYYKRRNDYLPVKEDFSLSSVADEYGGSFMYRANPNQRLSINMAYRNINYKRTNNDTVNKADSSISGRLQYNSRWLDGVVTSSMFYEASSGMERKREYMFVEVPPGQGTHVWIDYNENGIMELDEFEIAQYPDEANFIKVFIPTDDFIKVFSNVYSHSVNIDPRLAWHEESGIKKFLSRFSNQTSFSANKKTKESASFNSFNPFYINMYDTLLTSLNSSFRNSLFFNRIDPVFGMELTFRDERNKMLLSNGYEKRQNEILSLNSRWNITRQYGINLLLSLGNRTNESEFFISRNFNILSYKAKPTINIMFSNNFRVGVFYGFEEKENTFGNIGEHATTHKAGLDTRINFPGKSSINARVQVSKINYPFDENTPLAFDMLESLKPGTNQLWNISWQHNLNEYLMLILNYHGRKSPETPVVHTGNVQVRAFF